MDYPTECQIPKDLFPDPKARPSLLALDEVGYLAYHAHAADLLFEIVNHRYERNSIVLTTNKAFKEWNAVFSGRNF